MAEKNNTLYAARKVGTGKSISVQQISSRNVAQARKEGYKVFSNRTALDARKNKK